MPNHVTNILTIFGTPEQVKQVLEHIANKEQDSPIDFNKIDPMPTILSFVTTGHTTIDGIPYQSWMYIDKETEKPVHANYMDPDWKKKVIEVGLTYEDVNALKQEAGGFADWYEWSRSHWGTKWNAYDSKMLSENSIQFDTAWSTPSPVIQRLSAIFPDVTFEVEYADEDLGNNVGFYDYAGGVITDDVDYSGEREGIETAVRIKYGQTLLQYVKSNIEYDLEYAKELAERYDLMDEIDWSEYETDKENNEDS